MARAEIKAGISLDKSKFDGPLESIKSKLGGMGGIIAGAFSVGMVMNFGRRLLQTADDMQTAANTFDVSLESMIAFKSAMAESGIGADRFMRIFGRLNSSMQEAWRGVKTYVDGFALMNISQREFAGLKVDKVFELIARKYQEAGDKAEFMGGVSKIFGERIGPQLIEVFQRLNQEGLEKFIANAAESAEGIRKLAKASDALEKTGNTLIIWAAKFVGALSRVAEKSGIIWSRIVGDIDTKQMDEMLAKVGEAKEKTDELMAGKEGIGVGYQQAELDKWYKLYEDHLLRQKDLLGQIAYWEEEITKLREAQAGAPGDLGIASEILEREKKVADLKEKSIKQQEEADRKRDDIYREQDKLARETEERQKDILKGKGIERPREARVGPLQAIGLIVGGVAGGDAAARRAERQEKMQEAQKTLLEESNLKLGEIHDEIFKLGEATS